MCGRYTLTIEREDLEERFGARFSDANDRETDTRGDPSEKAFAPRYNMAPGQRLPVITDDEPETIRRLEWGLIPSWAEDDSGGLINARAETVDEKPSFRAAYNRRQSREGNDRAPDTSSAGRCLVLADGFYEWVETEDGKRPYRVAFEDDRPFAMAGLWERWEPSAETTQAGLDAFGGGVESPAADDGPLETFTIITTEPNDLVSELHHRMAVILDPAAEREWLTAADPRDLLEPYPADELRAYPVSRAVNDPATDEPSLIESVEP
ncbi:SOS response-associated peptidase [Natronorubrum sp. JWXQ-INN-674]|uniref:SOS response-associated peptidase n=1 Tax=Natronorubrum halalkaliphilum TaxID=2691917 RepID=A0A6B0VPL6_9EURY|nr:SOS response-associated peptidase [Natronorubrum halalkaliphilum]MXV63077.1 SOS response-associated peptidase [Natronorubrum halalkaliphilum]